jgi:hypothetical protein
MAASHQDAADALLGGLPLGTEDLLSVGSGPVDLQGFASTNSLLQQSLGQGGLGWSDEDFVACVHQHGRDFKTIARVLGMRSDSQVSKEGVRDLMQE